MASEKNQNGIASEADYGQVFFHWKFPEFIKYQRGSDWYFKAAAVVAFLLLFAVFNPQLSFSWPFIAFSAPNFTFMFVVLLTALLVLLFHRSDNEIDFQITEDGVLVNKKFYEYKEIKNFYLIYEPPLVKTLYFEPKSLFQPRIPVALQDQDPIKIREILRRYLAEDLKRENEPISDQVSRMFKL